MQVTVGGVRFHCELAGNEHSSAVMFSHSLGGTLGIWDAQVPDLGARFRLLRYDTRGHGNSAAPPGPYSLADMVDDVRGLLDALRIERTHFVGISMGGMVGQLFALRHPERLSCLVLSDTTSETPPLARPLWEERIRITEEQGMEPHVEPTMERWFTEAFRRRHPEQVARIATMVRQTDPRGYVACCRAIEELDLTSRLEEVRAPTLVLVGAQDTGTPPAAARGIHERIRGSKLRVLDSAAHLSNVEQSEEWNRVVAEFLERHDARSSGAP